jgi:hypothetical protein
VKRAERKRERERAEHRREWETREEGVVEGLALEARPLNDRLGKGIPVWPQELLSYIAALERRVERLEHGDG